VLAGADAWRFGLFDGVAASGYDGMALKNIDIDSGLQRERMPASSHPANTGQGPHTPESRHPDVGSSAKGGICAQMWASWLIPIYKLGLKHNG
jgi:hypothetical protein